MKIINLIKIISVLCLISIGLFFYGCQQNITNGSNIVFPTKNVSFISHVYPFLQVTCAYVGCHDDQSQQAGIRITDYFSLFQTTGLIVPGNPDGSLLVQLLNGKQLHMPIVYWKADSNQINGIRQWILEGAKNN